MRIVELQYPLAPTIDLPLGFEPEAIELNGATLSVFGISVPEDAPVSRGELKIVKTGEVPPSNYFYHTYLGNGLHCYRVE